MKLYRITLQGMLPSYGISYVVAENSDSAYQKVRKFLDKENLGFTGERNFSKAELIADEKNYGEINTMLYL